MPKFKLIATLFHQGQDLVQETADRRKLIENLDSTDIKPVDLQGDRAADKQGYVYEVGYELGALTQAELDQMGQDIVKNNVEVAIQGSGFSFQGFKINPV